MSKTSPLVTVGIPLYKAEATIARALRSVQEQTFNDLEILIINDCTPDSSLEVIERFADDRIRIIHHQKNKGEAGARNTLMDNARGKYLAYLDSDDVWYPTKLEAQLRNLLSTDDIRIASTCHYHIEMLDSGAITTRLLKEPENWTRFFLISCLIGPGTTLVANVEFMRQVGEYDTRLVRRTDHDWMLRFAEKGGKLKISPEVLAKVYADFTKSISAGEESLYYFLEKHHSLYTREGLYEKALTSQLTNLLNISLNTGNWKIARRQAWDILQISPLYLVRAVTSIIDGKLGRPLGKLYNFIKP